MQREDLCIYCQGDLLSPSFLYSDYVRSFEKLETLECSNGRFRIHHIARIKGCKSHYFHILCLYDYFNHYVNSKRSTRGRNRLLTCPDRRCNAPFTSWTDIVLLNPGDCAIINNTLVKLCPNLLARWDTGDPIVTDFSIPLNTVTYLAKGNNLQLFHTMNYGLYCCFLISLEVDPFLCDVHIPQLPYVHKTTKPTSLKMSNAGEKGEIASRFFAHFFCWNPDYN